MKKGPLHTSVFVIATPGGQYEQESRARAQQATTLPFAKLCLYYSISVERVTLENPRIMATAKPWMPGSYREVCDIVCNILYDLDEITENDAKREIHANRISYGHPNINDLETYAHYENCGCEQINQEDIPIIFRGYFYFTNQHDTLELVDLYSDVENDPTKPRTLQELAVIMARERLKFWLNYRMSIFRYHYCDFVRLQDILLTTMGIPLAVSKLVLPSLREPRYALHFPDTMLLHKSPGELFFFSTAPLHRTVPWFQPKLFWS